MPDTTLSRKVFKSGVTTCRLNMLPGCCGVAVISNLRFYPTEGNTNEDLFKAFYKYLLKYPYTQAPDDHLGRALYLFTDKIPLKGGWSPVYKFCKYNKLRSSSATYNHRSRNKIQVFLMDRRELRKKSSV